MFNPQAFENSRPDGIGVLEILEEIRSEEQPRRFVPLKRTFLKGEVVGPLVSLRVMHTFAFSAEQESRTIEALYRFPLPGDAAITSVWVRFGDVEIKAHLKERAQAESEYQKARDEGRQSTLVTRESPDVFTLHIAGIEPGRDVVVETSYVQLARPEGAGWSLRVPLTTSPRYVRGDEATSRQSQGQPLALLRDPGHRFAMELTIRGAGTVASSTHKLDVNAEGDKKLIRLKDGEVIPDRDCVLTWQPVQQSQAGLQIWTDSGDPDPAQRYFLALVSPPATHDRGKGAAREVILLVDHSGSMEGAKWQAADWAVERFLSDLNERDTFALGLFHSTTKWLAKSPRSATPKAIAEAVAFLKANRESGGTELGVALEQALSLERRKGELARHVLIITDAEVTDAGRLTRLAGTECQMDERRRISLLCIDAAPNALLATDLAERGGGVARFLTSAPQEEDITTALDEVLADWSEPILLGLRLEVDRPGMLAANRTPIETNTANSSAIDLADLPAGRAIWVCGRVPVGTAKELNFRAKTDKHEVARCRVDLTQAGESRPAFRALFGARRLRELENIIHSGFAGDELRADLLRLGYDEAELARLNSNKIYHENQRAELEDVLKKLLVQESLLYGLACAETAFVASRTESGKPVEQTVIVANALPAGWSEGFALGARGGFNPTTAMFCIASPVDSAMMDMDMDMAGDPGLQANAAMRGPRKSSVAKKTAMSASVRKTPCYMPGQAETQQQQAAHVIFRGTPHFTAGEAILFDSLSGNNPLPNHATITEVEIRFPDGTPKSVDADLWLLIFADDPASPRARVRLADMVRHGGKRPLNLLNQPGQLLRIVLADANGVWSKKAPKLEVSLRNS